MLTTTKNNSILNSLSKSVEVSNSSNAVVNIVILGDPKSGKTSLIECFLNNKIEDKNTDTILNIYQTKFYAKNYNFTINFFEISGYYERDKDLVIDYIKYSNIILLCHSFEQDFSEENFTFWLEQIEKKAELGRGYVYLIGCKYDLKVMMDYQKGVNITTLMFQNGNLASFGERVKTFINNNLIKEYFLVSSLLNFNIKEMFHSVIKDYIYDNYLINNKNGNSKDNQNCRIF